MAWTNENPAGRMMILSDSDVGGHFELQTELVDRFDADYEVQCDVGDRTVSQSVRIQCRPVDSRLNQVRLSWPEPPQGTWTWTLEIPGGLRSQPLSAIEERSAVNGSVTTLLQWGEGIDQPFVIVGRSESGLGSELDPSTSPRRASSASNRRSDCLQLGPRNCDLSKPGVGSTSGVGSEATARLATARCVRIGGCARHRWHARRAFAATARDRSTTPPRNRWSGLLGSTLGLGRSRSRHRLSLDVAVEGDLRLQVTPASSFRLRRVTIDGQVVDTVNVVAQPTADNTPLWRIPLTPVPTRQRVVLDYTSQECLSDHWQILAAAFPDIDAAVFRSDWVVHLPAGYRVAEQVAAPGDAGCLELGRMVNATLVGAAVDPSAARGFRPAEGRFRRAGSVPTCRGSMASGCGFAKALPHKPPSN